MIFILFFIGSFIIIANAIKAGTGKTIAENINEKQSAIEKRQRKDVFAVDNDQSSKAEITRQCLTEQLIFIEDLLCSESNPEKTLKYMKEKQRILTALADL